MNKLVQITPRDMVAVALQPLEAGETLDYGAGSVTLLADIPMGHKVALRDIRAGEPVIKYGFPIGEALGDIPRGGHVHTHNLKTLLSGELEYRWQPADLKPERVEPVAFDGYRREDGRVGIRNELWIIPTVGCVNDVATALERRMQSLVGEGVDGVFAFRHPYGCSQMGDDQENTRQILADLCGHPNAGGVLLLGLGCENSGVDLILEHMGPGPHPRLRTLIAQQVEDELEAGAALLEELAGQMRADRRVPCDTRDLVVGLKCGGSDGLSGITANPAIGGFSDRLAARGGTTILTEVPEMFGAETILMNRCRDEETFQKTVRLINDFKRYFEASGQPVYENPSPGNKAGGITTLEDKSCGCVQKGGSAQIVDVLGYADAVKKKGLSILSAPGNDLVASTALTAAGAHIILFTTGRGTPFGAPAPTVKISTNTALYNKKGNWIDFNAGTVAEGESLDDAGDRLLDYVLKVASGEETKAEQHGAREISIFKDGVVL